MKKLSLSQFSDWLENVQGMRFHRDNSATFTHASLLFHECSRHEISQR